MSNEIGLDLDVEAVLLDDLAQTGAIEHRRELARGCSLALTPACRPASARGPDEHRRARSEGVRTRTVDRPPVERTFPR